MRSVVAVLVVALTACTSVATTTAPASTASTQPDVAQALPSPAAVSAACPAAATPAVTEGPYFRSGSPQRTSLVENEVLGTRLTLTGHVYGTGCVPLAGTVLDFWQADGNGQYDNSGYRLRGHQQTAADGSFHLDTVVPGLYPGRTEHIHVKVAAPGRATLTTQLFFPNSTTNAQDSIYRPELLVKLSGPTDALSAAYDFLIG